MLQSPRNGTRASSWAAAMAHDVATALRLHPVGVCPAATRLSTGLDTSVRCRLQERRLSESVCAALGTLHPAGTSVRCTRAMRGCSAPYSALGRWAQGGRADSVRPAEYPPLLCLPDQSQWPW